MLDGFRIDWEWSKHYCGHEQQFQWTLHNGLSQCAVWTIGAFVPVVLLFSVFILAFRKFNRLQSRLIATCDVLRSHSVLALDDFLKSQDGWRVNRNRNGNIGLCGKAPASACPYFPDFDTHLPLDPYPSIFSRAQIFKGVPAVLLILFHALMPAIMFFINLFDAVNEARHNESDPSADPNLKVARVPWARIIYIVTHTFVWGIFFTILAVKRLRTAIPSALAHNWHIYFAFLCQILLGTLWVHKDIMLRVDGIHYVDSKLIELQGGLAKRDFILALCILLSSTLGLVFMILAQRVGWAWFHDMVRAYLILGLTRVGKAFANVGDALGASGIAKKDPDVIDEASYSIWLRRARIREGVRWLLDETRFQFLSELYDKLALEHQAETWKAFSFPTCVQGAEQMLELSASRSQSTLSVSSSFRMSSLSTLINASENLVTSVVNRSKKSVLNSPGANSVPSVLLSPHSMVSLNGDEYGAMAYGNGSNHEQSSGVNCMQIMHSSARGELCASCCQNVPRSWIQVKKGVLYDDLDGGYSYFDYDDEADVDAWGIKPVGSTSALSMLRGVKKRGKRKEVTPTMPVLKDPSSKFDDQAEIERVRRELQDISSTCERLKTFDEELSNMSTHYVDLWKSVTKPDVKPSVSGNESHIQEQHRKLAQIPALQEDPLANAEIILEKIEEVKRLQDLKSWKELGVQPEYLNQMQIDSFRTSPGDLAIYSEQKTKRELDIEEAERIIDELDPLWESRAGHFSTLYFSWIHPLIRLGYLRPLKPQDVDDLPPFSTLRRILSQFDYSLAIQDWSDKMRDKLSAVRSQSFCASWICCRRVPQNNASTHTANTSHTSLLEEKVTGIRDPSAIQSESNDTSWVRGLEEDEFGNLRPTYQEEGSSFEAPYTRLSNHISNVSSYERQMLALQQEEARHIDEAYKDILKTASSQAGFDLPSKSKYEVEDSIKIEDLLQSIEAAIGKERRMQGVMRKVNSYDANFCNIDESSFKQAFTSQVFFGLWAVTGRRVLLACLSKLMGDMLSFVGPSLLALLVRYAGDVDKAVPSWAEFAGAKFYGLIISLVLAFSAVAQALFLQHSYHLTIREAFRARSLVIGLVYRKALRLSLSARNRVSVGRIQTLMSSDSTRVENVYWMGYYIIFAPIQCAIAIILLFNLLGWPTLVGVAVLVVALPTQLGMGKYMAKLTKRRLKFTDRRATYIMELLAAIRNVKLLGWDRAFSRLVELTRLSEIKLLRRQQIFGSLQSFVVQCIPTLVAVLTFVTFATAGNGQLTPARAFAALSLFSLVQIPLWSLPVTIQYIYEARISLIRIGEFLAEPERDAPGLLVDWEDCANLHPQTRDEENSYSNKHTSSSPLVDTHSEESKDILKASAQNVSKCHPSLALVPLLSLRRGEMIVRRRDFWATPYHSRTRPIATLSTEQLDNIRGELVISQFARIPGSGTYGFSWNSWHLGTIYRHHVRSFHPDHLHLPLLSDNTQKLNRKNSTPAPVLAVVMSREAEISNPQENASKSSARSEPEKKTENADAGTQIAAAPISVQVQAKKDGPFVTLDALMPVPTMHVPSLELKPGTLTVIVGPVGSGKSFLLQAILGEIYHSPSLFGRLSPCSSTAAKTIGQQTLSAVSPAPLRSSAAFTSPVTSIAYVPQSAWIVNATVRENITMGVPFVQSVYDETVNACELRADFDQFPAGDLTEISERGASLSGGQKQRVNIARAVYRRHICGVYLMDAPLAALDANVAKSVFDKVLGPNGLLKDHTRILVTHHIGLSKYADTVIMMQSNIQGGITPEQIVKNKADSLPQPKTIVTRMAHTMSPHVRSRGNSISLGNEVGSQRSGHSRSISRDPLTPTMQHLDALASNTGDGYRKHLSTVGTHMQKRSNDMGTKTSSPSPTSPDFTDSKSVLKSMQIGSKQGKTKNYKALTMSSSRSEVWRQSQNSDSPQTSPPDRRLHFEDEKTVDIDEADKHNFNKVQFQEILPQLASSKGDSDDAYSDFNDNFADSDETDNSSIAASVPEQQKLIMEEPIEGSQDENSNLLRNATFKLGPNLLQPHDDILGVNLRSEPKGLSENAPKRGEDVDYYDENLPTVSLGKRPAVLVKSSSRIGKKATDEDKPHLSPQGHIDEHLKTQTEQLIDEVSGVSNLEDYKVDSSDEPFKLALKLPLGIRIAQIGTYESLMNEPLVKTLGFDAKYLFLSGTAGTSLQETYGFGAAVPKLSSRQKDLLSLWLDRDSGEVISGLSSLSQYIKYGGSSRELSDGLEDSSEDFNEDDNASTSSQVDSISSGSSVSDSKEDNEKSYPTASIGQPQTLLKLRVSTRALAPPRQKWIGDIDPLEAAFHALFPPLIPFSVMVRHQEIDVEQPIKDLEKPPENEEKEKEKQVKDDVLPTNKKCDLSSSKSNLAPATGLLEKKEKHVKKKEVHSLIQRETKHDGALSWEIYLMYLWAMSAPLAFSSVFLVVGQAALLRLTDYWLSMWANDNGARGSSYFLKTYTYLSFGSILLNLIANIVGALAGIRAARVMHEKMLASVSQAPLSFFDTTPLGRILNRFSADTDAIDQKLPNSWSSWLNQNVQVASLLLVIAITNYWFVLGLVPVLALFAMLSQYYRNTSREIRRLENLARSPIFSHFEATLDGLVSVRALGVERGFLAACCSLTDTYSSIWYAGQCANRWLAIRLDTLGAFVLLSTACAMILGSPLKTDEDGVRHLNSGLIGLTISYALSVTSKLNWTVRSSIDFESQLSSVERVDEYSNIEPEAGCNPSQLYDEAYVKSLKIRPNIIASRLAAVPPSIKPPPPPSSLVQMLKRVDGDSDDAPTNIDSQWPLHGTVVFRSVYMRYRKDQPLVVRGISLSVDPGEKVAVVGRTGAGKSSLIQMLFRAAEHEGTRFSEAFVKYRYLLSDQERKDALKKLGSESSGVGLFEGVIVSSNIVSGDGSNSDLSLNTPLLQQDREVSNSSEVDFANLSTEEQALVSSEVKEFEPSKGRVFIDGIDISNIPLSMLRRSLSVIPQDPILFSGTIRFNLDPERELIRLRELKEKQSHIKAHQAGLPSPDELGMKAEDLKATPEDGDLWSSLESVGLLSLVSSLPGGLDFQLTNGDDLFSQGQRQLLCVARAVARRSQILVLDEATASVDPHTDAWVQRMVRTEFAKCTVITIAHRLSTVIDYDKVIVMERGRIVECGNPIQLRDSPRSVFAGMWRAHSHNP